MSSNIEDESEKESGIVPNKKVRLCTVCRKEPVKAGECYCKTSCRKKAYAAAKYSKVFQIGGIS